MMKLIVITGTPGTGKTTLAEVLTEKGFYRLDLHRHYKDISTGYNRNKQCYDIDLEKLEKLIRQKMKEHSKIVVDSHISHLLPKRLVDLCVVLTCSNLKKLKKRLENRKYSKKKVRENLDAEIFQVCLTESLEKGHQVKILDTGKRISKKEILKQINL